jgi:hypothetical protein
MERVQRIVASIRSGQFPVYNEDKDCTKSCPCRSICRIGQIRSLEKVWGDEGATDSLMPQGISAQGGSWIRDSG